MQLTVESGSPFGGLSDQDRSEMLPVVRANHIGELFNSIPRKHRFPNVNLAPALSELEVVRKYGKLAAENTTIDEMPSFLGGGVYNHFIPAAIGPVAGRSEFLTGYTPY